MAVDLSFLEPYFQALSQVPHLQQAAAQQEQQQQQLAETTRHDQADEAVAGRHADIAADAGRRAQQAQDLTQADTIMKNGWTPVPGAASSQGPAAAPAGGAAAPAAPLDLTDETTNGAADPSNATGGAPTQSFPGMTGAMMAAAPVAPATPRQTVSVGGQQYQAPPRAGTPEWKEEHARQLQQGIDDDAVKYGATLNREGMTVPDDVADVLQIPRGQKIMPEHMKALADLHNIVAPPDKQFKPEAPPSMVTLSPTDSKLMGLPAGTRVPMDEYKARGTVAAEASRAARGEGGGAPAEKPATKAQFGQVIKDKQTALADSKKQLDKDLAAANRSFTADDTFDKTGAITQAYQDHKSRLQQAQLSYEQRASQLSGNDVGHDPWADNLGTDKAAGGGANPGRGGNGGNGPKQLTDTAKVAEYLKKAGGDKVAARKLAAADNYVF